MQRGIISAAQFGERRRDLLRLMAMARSAFFHRQPEPPQPPWAGPGSSGFGSSGFGSSGFGRYRLG
jgi:protease PrsW